MVSLARLFPFAGRAYSAAFRYTVRFALTQLALGIVFAQSNLTLHVANETFAAGGWAQVKVYADSPKLISRGTLAIDLDPSVFGPIASIATFSANGDAMGIATVSGTHAEISMLSASGGIGQLPDVPVFAVRAPVLANAAQSGFVSLSLPQRPLIGPVINDPYPTGAWTDREGKAYTLTLLSGGAYSTSPISIGNVTPGVGFQPVATVLQIEGAGFTDATRITADGIAFSAMRLVSSSRIEATLASAVELTGVRFRLNQSNYSSTYFAHPASAISAADTSSFLVGWHAILPVNDQRQTNFNRPSSGGIYGILRNPSTAPIEVRMLQTDFGRPSVSRRYTLAPGSLVTLPAPGSLVNQSVDSEASFRAIEYFSNIGERGVRTASLEAGGGSSIQIIASASEVSADYQIGSTSPEPSSIRLYAYDGRPIENTLQITAGNWLTVTQLTTGTLSLAFNTGGLAEGTYTGTITATAVVPDSLRDFPAGTVTIQAKLTVSALPTISVAPFRPETAGMILSPSSFVVRTNGTVASYTTRVTAESGGDWLSVDKPTGSSGTTVNIVAKKDGLGAGPYYGTVFVQGPRNTVEQGVSFHPVYPPPSPPMAAVQSSITVVREQGSSDQSSTSIQFAPITERISATAKTDDGANWLAVETLASGTGAFAYVRVNIDGLAPGVYHGTVTGISAAQSAQARVTLNVVAKAKSPITVAPSSFTFSTPARVRSAAQAITVSSPDGPVLFRFGGGAAPLSLNAEYNPALNGQFMTPGTYSLDAYSTAPGTYQSNLTVTTASGVVTIPVTIYITASPSYPPVLTSIVNGASHAPGSIAPGEIITLRGLGIGPAAKGVALDGFGRIVSNAGVGTQVLINDVPAPILYGSPGQWNVIAPFELDGSSAATVKIQVNGVDSKTWTIPVGPAAPGIFTIGSSGAGRGAVLNQDNTVNSPDNVAPMGTIIQIFATGGGQTNPASATGSVTPSTGEGSNQLPVKVFFAGTETTVVYAGPAPGFASGAMQINAVVPRIGSVGQIKPAVAVTVEINGVQSAPVDVSIR